MQQRLGETFINLRAQPRDMHVDHVGLRVEMIVPHIFQQHGAGHHLPGMLHQVFEQAELARLQHDLLALAGHLMREPVELEVADPVDRLLAAAAPPRQHLGAREQLRERIGLGQIVVPARSPLTRSSTWPRADRMSAGVSMPLLRSVPMTVRPSSLGSMRSTMSTSYCPSRACASPSSPSAARSATWPTSRNAFAR